MISTPVFLVFTIKMATASSVIGTQFFDPGPHFRDVVKTRDKALFVDKSLLIKHILSGREHIVIEAAGGFGKTTNLRMLKEFLEMEVDIDGNPVLDLNTTKNYATFAEPPLKIFELSPEIFSAYFGQWPVLYVSFDTVSVSSFSDFEESFRHLVAEMFSRYDYLVRSERLSTLAKDDFELYRDLCPDLTVKEVALAGEKLSWLLREHHQHDIIVLIDDYDAPVRKAILSPTPGLDLKGFDAIFENVFLFIARLVKNNLHVTRSVLTGRLHIGATYVWEPDNLVHYSIFEDGQLSRYYGLTEEDIRALNYGLSQKSKRALDLDEIKAWYGGYITAIPGRKLINTFSTISYLKTHLLKRHRIEAEVLRSNLSKLLPYEKLGKALEEAFDQKTTVATVPKLVKHDLEELRMIVTVPGHKINSDLMFQYMAENGFYAFDGDLITVPNLEVDLDLKALILTRDYLKTKFEISDTTIYSYIEALDRLNQTNNDYRNLAAAVLGLFEHRLPASSREFLHALLHLAADTKFPHVTSEENVDRTRRDFFVQRYDSTGIILVVECGNSTAFDGLKKAVEGKFYEIFKQRSLQTGIMVGLSVNEKRECSISYLHDNHTFCLSSCKNLTLQGRKKPRNSS